MSSIVFPLRSTFLALPLEEKPKWLFQALQEELKPYEDCLRFQNPQSPHLTLQFWREVMEIEYEQIIQQTEVIAEKHAPFAMRVTGVEKFGTRSEDCVLFLTVAFSEELARLKKACPWPSAQQFSPHITLARVRHPQKFAVSKKKILKILGAIDFSVPVSCMRLYAEVHSIKQTPLQDFSLSGES